eukprot:scaffold4562_cov67-Cylindrotheca_fusiformis.AAC.1
MEEKRTRKTWDIEKVDPKWFVYTNETKNTAFPRQTLTHLRLDSSVGEIPAKAFKNCKALVQVQLPETLTRIGKQAFLYCINLKSVQFFSDYDSPETSSTNPNLEEGTIVFPERVKLRIDAGAFCECNSLRKVIVRSTTTKLGSFAFGCCLGLLYVELPEGLRVIESGMFVYCESLASVKIPSSVTKILGRAFSGCSSLAAVDLPHGLLEMGASSFSRCVALQTLCIRSTSSTVGQDAFEKGRLLNRIEREAFNGCCLLEYIEIPPT